MALYGWALCMHGLDIIRGERLARRPTGREAELIELSRGLPLLLVVRGRGATDSTTSQLELSRDV